MSMVSTQAEASPKICFGSADSTSGRGGPARRAPCHPVASILAGMGVPFLFCTGYQGGNTAGAHYPNAPVLGKPVNANNLLAVVNSLMSAAP